ncbi:unnamed protein product [Cladocopium goreaui]|uniref:Uncharacterized protein n=1 Tax=Cladocopium goreaui TaxID=2562237 RepID=A0A9P1DFI3_9DINO|nr:unnamed protein product [Cladocopium goreaui]
MACSSRSSWQTTLLRMTCCGADGNGPPLASPLASTSSIADVFGQLPKTANPSLDCATTLLLDEAKEEDNFERLGSNPETLPGSVKMKVFLTYK